MACNRIAIGTLTLSARPNTMKYFEILIKLFIYIPIWLVHYIIIYSEYLAMKLMLWNEL